MTTQPTAQPADLRQQIQALLDAAGYTYAAYAVAPRTGALVPAMEFVPDGWRLVVDFVEVKRPQPEQANGHNLASP